MRQTVDGITETHVKAQNECHCFDFLSFPSPNKMYSLKEKFIHNLSRLFPESPKSSPYPPQASTYFRKSKSLSSYWSYIFPSVGFNGSKTISHQSYSVRSNGENFDKDDDLSDKYVDFSPMSNNSKGKSNDEDQATRKSSSSSEAYEDVNEQHSPNTPKKSPPNFTDDSTFISPDLNDFFESCLPNTVKGCQRVLLYSTWKHGISLRTLIRNSAKLSGPSLLIVGDKQGAVFGGLLDCPLKSTAKRKYQGTNQTFVFTTIYGPPRLFRPTGLNRYYYLCLNDLLALGGGGGSSALCLDGDLLTGTSGPCDTFGNMCLAHSSEFELKNVEVMSLLLTLWGFTYASPYLKQD
ncbi:Oxidation resistance protein 1, partial [Mucuna pruriens]